MRERRLVPVLRPRTAAIIAAAVLTAMTAACSISDCAFYGGADSNVHCVITGPAPQGGYQ